MDDKLGVVDYKLSEVLQEFADMRSEHLPKTEGSRRRRKTVYRLWIVKPYRRQKAMESFAFHDKIKIFEMNIFIISIY